jgi:hypothetical protein
MKTKSIILSFFLFAVFSCEKSDLKHDLIGKWKIFGTSGGIHGQGVTFNFDYMYLDRRNDFRFSRHDTIIENGSYNLIDYDNTSSIGDFAINFVTKNRFKTGAEQITAQPMIVQRMTCDSIILYDGFVDGFGYYFVKQ